MFAKSSVRFALAAGKVTAFVRFGNTAFSWDYAQKKAALSWRRYIPVAG
jgi:hypothetical protein